MEAPTPQNLDINIIEKDLKEIQFLKEGFFTKLDNEIYIINIGILRKLLVIKVLNKNNMKKSYMSYFSFKQLNDISKSFRYFDDINEIISFIETKGKKNEISLKKKLENIIIEFKISSPNGKEENIILELKENELSNKEIISLLLQKVDSLEKEVEILKEKVTNCEKIISQNKTQFDTLFKEIDLLKGRRKETIENKNNKIFFDSQISNINEIDFIIDYLKETSLFKNKVIRFNLLYRGTRDGDNTALVHKKCCGLKNIIIFMKSEQGNRYGGFSNIGWETREEGHYKYPIDNNAFLFSLNNKKIFEAINGKSSMCWIDDEYGLCFTSSLAFYNNFLTKKNISIHSEVTSYFKDCIISDFNSGINECKLSDLEIYQIQDFFNI